MGKTNVQHSDVLSISVVVPCYNIDEYIDECIASILSQNTPSVEIICVNDGSTDNTLARLREIEVASGGAIKVLSDSNHGASVARNVGLAIARGEYVQFLDADDLINPRKFEHQLELVNRASVKPDIICASYIRRYTSGKEIVYDPHADDEWIGLASTRLGITSSNLWRRSSLNHVGGWHEDLQSSQEYDLMFRLLKTGAKILIDEEPLTIVRHRESGSISTSDVVGNWKRYVQLRREIVDHLVSRSELTPSRESVLNDVIFGAIRSMYGHDRNSANSYFNKYVPTEYSPSSMSSYSSLYLVCFKIFGFSVTERLRRGLKKLLSYEN